MTCEQDNPHHDIPVMTAGDEMVNVEMGEHKLDTVVKCSLFALNIHL